MNEPFLWIAGVAAVLCAIGVGVWFLLRATSRVATEIVHAPADAAIDFARALGEEFRKTFQVVPEIHVESEVIHSAPRGVRELHVVESTELIRVSWSDRRWLSKKRVELSARYVFKFGFDLTQVRIDVQRTPLRMRVELPAAKFFGAPHEQRFEREENGLWNRIGLDDRNRALAALQEEAQKSAERSGNLARAREELQRFLGAHARACGASLEMVDATPELPSGHSAAAGGVNPVP